MDYHSISYPYLVTVLDALVVLDRGLRLFQSAVKLPFWTASIPQYHQAIIALPQIPSTHLPKASNHFHTLSKPLAQSLVPMGFLLVQVLGLGSMILERVRSQSVASTYQPCPKHSLWSLYAQIQRSPCLSCIWHLPIQLVRECGV